jgi:hypothetical protein
MLSDKFSLEVVTFNNNSKMQKDNNHTTTIENLHDFESELFLGFAASDQLLDKPSHENSFVGGSPLWL